MAGGYLRIRGEGLLQQGSRKHKGSPSSESLKGGGIGRLRENQKGGKRNKDRKPRSKLSAILPPEVLVQGRCQLGGEGKEQPIVSVFLEYQKGFCDLGACSTGWGGRAVKANRGKGGKEGSEEGGHEGHSRGGTELSRFVKKIPPKEVV